MRLRAKEPESLDQTFEEPGLFVQYCLLGKLEGVREGIKEEGTITMIFVEFDSRYLNILQRNKGK